MMHPNVIGGLLDSHQQREQLGERDSVQPNVDSGFLIALNDDGGLRLHADDAIANLRRRRRFFHERQQRKLSRRARHALFEFGNPRLLDHVLLRDKRKFLAVSCFPFRLSIEFVDRRHERIDDQQKDQRCCDHGPACRHDEALSL